MMQTPDAPPGDVEAGANCGHDASGGDDPQNPIGASAAEVAEDEAPLAEAPTEVVAQEIDDEVGDDEAAQDTLRSPGDTAARQAGEDETDVEDLAPQAPAAAPPEDPAVLDLRAQVAELTRSLVTTQRRADELATVARKQTEMADELHADNRRLRSGEIREALAPLVRGLARLADDLSRMRATTAASEDLAYLDGQVSELLHDAGVLTVQAEIGEPFDPRCHQAAGSATTAVVELNRTIAEVRRSGLRRDDGRMLRPVDVVVFRYVAPAQPANEEVT